MNPLRNGNFTSSGIVALTTNPTAKAEKEGAIFSVGGLTYIQKKKRERKLKRSIESGTTGRDCWWGKVCELQAFNVLPTAYSISSDSTEFHHKHSNWCGSKDGEKHSEAKTVFDIKCPFTLDSFCTFAECKTIDEVRDLHKDGEKYYWQLVSNACITGATHAELIVYCPYQDELDEIRELASNYDGNQNKVAWINFASDDELPYLLREGEYKNLHIISFEVPESDKLFLENRIIEASKLLNA